MPLSINFDWETILEQMEDLSFLLLIPLEKINDAWDIILSNFPASYIFQIYKKF